MDKVYKKYKEMKMNPQKLMDELGIEIADSGGDSLGMGVVRKETDLSNEEKQFLLAVERGDIPTTRHFLEESQIYFNININCVDPLGRTALLIAIENENIEMIEVLLSFNIEVGDALLHAINEENVEAVELLLVHQSQNKKDLSRSARKRPVEPTVTEVSSSPNSMNMSDGDTPQHAKASHRMKIRENENSRREGFLGGVPSTSFTPDITPIILAAHRDNYEIIKILLDRGDRIAKPHDVRCNCTECISKANEDSLNHSRSRINAYRALASPSLISLSSKDPILTAFELSWELKRLSRLENEFKVEYETLAKQSQDFAVALLDQTRGSKELELVLNYDTNCPVNDNEERMNLSRLKLAIKYKQKKFVAHPNCQQLLASLWYEGLPGFRRRHIVFKVLLAVSVCLLYPVLSILYMVAPRSSIGLFMRRPFIKFICHSASYMTFLFLLILASQRIESIINLTGEGDDTNTKMTREVRGAPPTSIEWMILAYVAGLVWAEVKQLWNDGAKAYVQDMWNILDFTTNSLYIATFALKLVAYIRVQNEIREGNPAAYIARAEWDAYDPNLISEGLFAAANIFSSLKLIYIFTVNPQLGPLQISLGRMVTDVMNFLFIAILVIFSYSCGVNQLYWYYAEARQKDCDVCLAENPSSEPIECGCDRSLANLFEILQTLYFAVYGLVDIKRFELTENHEFTQFVGKLMFGTYSAIMIVVLINMLIAMLSTSFQYISNDADTEWKYARSKLWMSYFEDGETVPTPFNILPTPKSVYYCFSWVKDKLCHCSKKAKRSKWQSIRKYMKRINEREARYQKVVKKINERDAFYQAVMRDLVKRYIMQRQRTGQTEGVTEDDLNEIKQDISSFRYELLEILRNNGMKTPQYNHHQKHNSRSKLRRKGSRMSMERMQRQIMVETIPEAGRPGSMPPFLEKAGSIQSNGSEPGTPVPKQGSNGNVMKGGVDSGSPSSKNGQDEGLGESFDQQSELGDSSYSLKALNNQMMSARQSNCDTVEEEKSGETDAPSGSSETQENVNNEVVMDPGKLPYCDVHQGGSPDSTYGQKVGSNKKVSFFGGKEDVEKDGEPVSDTYVYEGKSRKKIGKSKWRNKKS